MNTNYPGSDTDPTPPHGTLRPRLGLALCRDCANYLPPSSLNADGRCHDCSCAFTCRLPWCSLPTESADTLCDRCADILRGSSPVDFAAWWLVEESETADMTQVYDLRRFLFCVDVLTHLGEVVGELVQAKNDGALLGDCDALNRGAVLVTECEWVPTAHR